MAELSIQNELRQKFKKSDALIFIKELCEKMPIEERDDFTSIAMKSAYDRNRFKAVDYFLSLEGCCNANLLLIIHVQRMLSDEKVFNSGRKMLQVLFKHFEMDDFIEKAESFTKAHLNNNDILERKAQLMYLLYDFNLSKNNEQKTKKLKI